MIGKAERRLLFWWMMMVTATLISVETRSPSGHAGRAAAVAALIIAFAKAWVVIWHFMDVRLAPMAMKAALGVWVVAVCAGLIGLWAFR